MKSLVEEASSVSKAIEKAWIRAGKPISFSIKIYEEAQSGFLGFNSRPAKIGLFFEEQALTKNNLEGRKKHHSSHTPRDDHERSARPIHKNTAEETTENPQPRRPYRSDSREGSRDRNSRDRDGHRDQRSSERRRPFEKKEFNHDDRRDRNNRPARARHDNESFEKREQNTPTQTTFIPNDTPVIQPVATQQPQPSTRRVLKVSSRRYVAPKNESPVSTSPAPLSSSDDNSTK